MMKKKGTMAVAAAGLLLAAAGAQALELKTGSDKVATTLYGQISRAVMYGDDGYQDKFFHVDNDNSSTRVGLKGEIAATENLTVGSVFEVEWQDNPSNKVSMQEESIPGEFGARHFDIWFKTQLGKLHVGRGDMASTDSSEVDISGTKIASKADLAVGTGFLFYNAAASDYSDVVVGKVFDAFDGVPRLNRVRYETPSFGGFSLIGAAGEGDTSDMTLAYSGEISETKVKGALSYGNPGKGYSQLHGSVSALMPFGLSLTVASGTRDLDIMPAGGDDPTFMYGKVGYICKNLLPEVGSTAVSVDYGVYENARKQTLGEEGTVYGVQFVQNLSAWNTDIYAAYQNFELENNTGADYEPISVMMLGAMIKF
uniref:porin n=1 Tax=Candidatus Electronema sp. TaxID=2698783 RepID=UPI004057AFF5